MRIDGGTALRQVEQERDALRWDLEQARARLAAVGGALLDAGCWLGGSASYADVIRQQMAGRDERDKMLIRLAPHVVGARYCWCVMKPQMAAFVRHDSRCQWISRAIDPVLAEAEAEVHKILDAKPAAGEP